MRESVRGQYRAQTNPREHVYIATDEFQLPPHQRRMRSPPHSWYSSLVTAYLHTSERSEQCAIPRHASRTGLSARRTKRGISGGRIGRRTLCRRGMSSGSCEGAPVTKTFYQCMSNNSPTGIGQDAYIYQSCLVRAVKGEV